MIIHDIFTRRKGTVEGFAEEKSAQEHQPTLRLASLKKAITDLYRTPENSRARHNNIHLSPLRQDIEKKRDVFADKEQRAHPGPREQRVETHTVLFLLLAVVLGLFTLRSVAAWNATGIQMAYVRNQLEQIHVQAQDINASVAAGRMEETLAQGKKLQATLNDFSRGLRMRLLLPNISSHPTDTQLPVLTLEVIGHILNALDAYQQATVNIRGVPATGLTGPSGNFIMAFQSFAQATAELSAASLLLESVPKTGMPLDMRSLVDHMSASLRDVLHRSQNIVNHRSVILDLLGERYPRRYAFLLQNADEMRPTGGFIGSVAFVEISSGKAGEVDFRDVYELDWKSSDTVVPEELKGLTKEYGLRDSNRMNDFSQSGKEAMGFFDRQGLDTVDVVVAINHRLIVKLLQASGPLSIPSLRAPLTAENFSPLLSLFIESKQNPNKPKEIMKEVIAAMLQRATTDPSRFLGALLSEIRDGNVAAYSVHHDAQALFQEWSVAGIMRTEKENEDYLLIVESNMGGNKSDRYISQQMSHLSAVHSDGTVQDTLRITRQHTFTTREEAMIRDLANNIGINPMSDDLLSIMGKGTNKSVIRVSVPLGSRITSVQGVPSDTVATSEQFGKTVFSFQMNVAPGVIGNVSITYTLPFQLDASSQRYVLVLDKQIGQKPIPYEKRLRLPSAVRFDGKQEQSAEQATQIILHRSETFTTSWTR